MYVFWDQKCARLVPCSAITAKKNFIIKVLIREFLKEDIHTSRIAVRHNEKEGVTSQWFHGTICVTVLPDMVTRDRRTSPFPAPTVFRFVNSSKAGFILKQQMDFFTCGKLYLLDLRVNFFEVAMTSSSAFLGCRLRGMIFRHP